MLWKCNKKELYWRNVQTLIKSICTPYLYKIALSVYNYIFVSSISMSICMYQLYIMCNCTMNVYKEKPHWKNAWNDFATESSLIWKLSRLNVERTFTVSDFIRWRTDWILVRSTLYPSTEELTRNVLPHRGELSRKYPLDLNTRWVARRQLVPLYSKSLSESRANSEKHT